MSKNSPPWQQGFRAIVLAICVAAAFPAGAANPSYPFGSRHDAYTHGIVAPQSVPDANGVRRSLRCIDP